MRHPLAQALFVLVFAASACSADLHGDAAAGNLTAIRQALDAGGDVNARDKDGATALHCAVEKDHAAVVNLLIERGANVNARRRDGATPLHLAARNRGETIAWSLLAAGADRDLADGAGLRPMDVARRARNAELERLLRGCDFTETLAHDIDTGINVLVDSAHEYLFDFSWAFPPMLRQSGIRAINSLACLDRVLKPGEPANTLLIGGVDERYSKWPCSTFNVVLTYQGDANAQDYTPAERRDLRTFVEQGGGLLIIGEGVKTPDQAARWPLNALGRDYGVRVGDKSTTLRGQPVPSLSLDGPWEVRAAGTDGRPIMAVRSFGKGRVASISTLLLVRSHPGDADPAEMKRADATAYLADLVRWLSAGRPPAGGPARLPVEFHPENQVRVGKAIVSYASNQRPDLIKCITDELPAVKKKLDEWIPSPPRQGSYPMLLCAGGGGGFAAGDEVAVMALTPSALLSVFGHEMAHCMPGPANDLGQQAGRLPNGFLLGEGHAGWFQRKIQTMWKGEPFDPNTFFKADPTGREIDLARVTEKEVGANWSIWDKLFFVFQKLDERYGTTWYPRWVWVKSTRWRNTPGRMLTWDEVVEDMSIAVGEDLYPFFRALGTSLAHDRCGSIQFQGKPVDLPPAPLGLDRCGPLRFEPAGDYTRPLSRRAKAD